MSARANQDEDRGCTIEDVATAKGFEADRSRGFELSDYITTRQGSASYMVNFSLGWSFHEWGFDWWAEEYRSFSAADSGELDELLEDEDRSLAISPIIWANNHRLSDNFQRANWAGVEFDSGELTLDAAKLLFARLDGLIYTTKSHGIRKNDEPACDRFRAFVGISRAIDSIDDWCRFQGGLLLLFPSACPNNTDGARMFYSSIPGCEIVHLGGNNVIDVDKVLQLAKENSIKGYEGGRRLRSLTLDVKNSQHLYNKRLYGRLERWIAKQREGWEKQDTYKRFWAVLLEAIDMLPVIAQVAGTIKQLPFVQEWLSRHPQQSRSYDEQVAKAFLVWNERQGIYRPIGPQNTVETIDTNSLPPISKDHLRILNDYRLKWDTSLMPGDAEATHKLFQHLAEQEEMKAILCAPCGTEKTTAMRCYVAANANEHRRFLIVKRTRRDAAEERTLLSLLGATDIGLLVGYDREKCSLRTPRHWRVMYHQKDSPCLSCNSLCDFGRTLLHKADEMQKSILIVTHERFLSMVCGSKGNAIPSDMTVIIDESLSWFETYTLTPFKLSLLISILPEDSSERLQKYAAALGPLLLDNGAHKDPHNYMDYDSLKRARRAIHKLTMTDGEFEIASEFINFFLSSCGYRYVMQNNTSKTWHFITSRIQPDLLPNRIIILDGSARDDPTTT